MQKGLAIGVLALAWVAVTFVVRELYAPPLTKLSASAVQSITFTHWDGDTHTIRDAAEIALIVEMLAFKEIESCKCLHQDAIVFHTVSGEEHELRMSGHSLVLRSSSLVSHPLAYYATPRNLYRYFDSMRADDNAPPDSTTPGKSSG